MCILLFNEEKIAMGMGGAMDSCGRCLKYSLICINVVTLIAGIIAFSLGIWVWSQRSFSTTLLSSNMFVASLGVVIVMGAAIMLLSLLGCCGAAKEVKCMLLTYYIIVFIIFVVMLVGGILQFVFREKALSTLDRELYAAIPYYGAKHEYTKAWDDTQTYLQCCGVRGSKDWNGNIPESCCQEVYPGKRRDCRASPNPTTMYVDGCLDKVVDFLRQNAVYVGVAAIIVALIMLIALILACGLFVKIE
ncbi:leukocyte surface antigen CD53-like isoform X2 [Plodia interpunctella]|uniref:leukocyte surface antigen CD53-like isoform X2 n=1 Tax=Plodia interpunctella TaxID=58824 RepID=UPI00236896B0|nr:leukocyte surface antigen CD53-like isoform X2 [Plodia interpunctella]